MTTTVKKHHFTSADGITDIKVKAWWPKLAPKATVIIAHGIGEHVGRYDEVANKLNQKGIAVYAMDFIGHGGSISEDKAPMYFGEAGWDYLVEDLITLNKFVKRVHPETPCFLLGFSLGSFAFRTALAEYSDEIEADGAIFVGTGKISGIVAALVTRMVGDEADRIGGEDNVSDMVNDLAFGNYNKHFKPTRTQFDWLCKDEVALDDYINDPVTAKFITPGMFMDLLDGMARASKKSSIRNTKNIPILFVSGKEDPVGDFTKGVKKVANMFKKYNSDVTTRFYPNARHAVMHEKCKDDVISFLNFWINKHI